MGNPGKFFWKKAFLRRNQNCHILGTKGRRKLKFGEVAFRYAKIFWEISEQNFYGLNALLEFLHCALKTVTFMCKLRHRSELG